MLHNDGAGIFYTTKSEEVDHIQRSRGDGWSHPVKESSFPKIQTWDCWLTKNYQFGSQSICILFTAHLVWCQSLNNSFETCILQLWGQHKASPPTLNLSLFCLVYCSLYATIHPSTIILVNPFTTTQQQGLKCFVGTYPKAHLISVLWFSKTSHIRKFVTTTGRLLKLFINGNAESLVEAKLLTHFTQNPQISTKIASFFCTLQNYVSAIAFSIIVIRMCCCKNKSQRKELNFKLVIREG